MRPTSTRTGDRRVVVFPLRALFVLMLVIGSAPGLALAVCGDAVLESGEQCDDGNEQPGDCCDSTCQVETPGQVCELDADLCTADVCDETGACTFAEPVECDDLDPCNGLESCSPSLGCEEGVPPAVVCGDGIACGGEPCDDGNASDEDGCKSDCTPNVCGDGIPWIGVELCDDGNLADDDGCDSNCTPTGCGNGVPTSGEECDTGGDSATCDADCTVAECADGVTNAAAGESCDDSNLTNCDGCDDVCRSEPTFASWCFGGGPDGGIAFSMAIDPTTPDTLYVGSRGAVFRSLDGAVTWRAMEGGIQGNEVHGLAVGTGPNPTLLAATHGRVYRALSDEGEWNVADGSSGTACIASHDFAFDPSDPDLVFMGRQDGVHQSEDGGLSWTRVLVATGACAVAFDPSDSATVYAASSQGFSKSADGGDTWVTSAVGNGFSCLLACGFGVDPTDSSRVFLSDGQGIHRSLDGGSTWTKVFNQGSATVFVRPDDPLVVYAGSGQTGGFLKSTDGGDTWTETPLGTVIGDIVFDLAVDPRNYDVIYAASLGLFKSIDGGDTWTPMNRGFHAAAVFDLAFDATNDRVYASTLELGVWVGEASGTLWSPRHQGLPVFESGLWLGCVVVDPDDPDQLYSGEAEGGGNCGVAMDGGDPETLYAAGRVFRSTNAGGTWAEAFPYGFAKSVNGGINWSPLTLGVPGVSAAHVVTDPTTGGVVYAITTGLVPRIFRSSDAGSTWSEVANPGVSIRHLLVDPTDGAILYAATASGVFRSDDTSATWVATGPALPPGSSPTAVAVDPLGPTVVYAAVPGIGVYRTRDRGGSWEILPGDGLSNLLVRTVEVGVTSLPLAPFARGAGTGAETRLWAGSADAGGASGIFRRASTTCEEPPCGICLVPGACDDGDACTRDLCDPATGCTNAPAPDPACTSAWEKGSLLVKENVPGKEEIVAKLFKGPALSQLDLGNPLAPGGTSYTMCIYDDAGALAGRMEVDRAGADCAGKPCWKSLGALPPGGKGYSYKDTAATADGIGQMKLKSGEVGTSKILVKGSNDAGAGETGLPTGIAAALSSSSSATIQMFPSDAPQCLSLEVSDITKQGASFFKAKK